MCWERIAYSRRRLRRTCARSSLNSACARGVIPTRSRQSAPVAMLKGWRARGPLALGAAAIPARSCIADPLKPDTVLRIQLNYVRIHGNDTCLSINHVGAFGRALAQAGGRPLGLQLGRRQYLCKV